MVTPSGSSYFNFYLDMQRMNTPSPTPSENDNRWGDCQNDDPQGYAESDRDAIEAAAAADGGGRLRPHNNLGAAGSDSDEESYSNPLSGADAAASGNYVRFSAARAVHPQCWDWHLRKDAMAGDSAGVISWTRDRVSVDANPVGSRPLRVWDDVMDIGIARTAELGIRQNESFHIYDRVTGQHLKASGTPISAAGAVALGADPRTLLVMAPAKQVPSYEQWMKNNGEKTNELFTAIRSGKPETLSTFLKLNPTFNVHTLSENFDLYQPVASITRKPLFEVCLNTQRVAIEFIEEMAKLLILHTKSQPSGDTYEMINHVDSTTSMTPLMLAAHSTRSLFSLLLLNGGDPFVFTQKTDTFSIFKPGGPDIEYTESTVLSPIHLIAKYGKPDNLTSLVNYFNSLSLWKDEVSATLKNTQLAVGIAQGQASPLIKLIFDYVSGTIKELVNLQPVPHAPTPLFHAVFLSMDPRLGVGLVRSLLEKGADPRTPVPYKWTTLSVLRHCEEGFGIEQMLSVVQLVTHTRMPDGRRVSVRRHDRPTIVPPGALLQLLRAKVIELDDKDKSADKAAAGASQGGSAGASTTMGTAALSHKY